MALRIIAGTHRGRKIETHSDKTLRPTSGRTREAVFNILMHGEFAGDNSPIMDKRVVDIFCGSGAYGFEALSRGAKHATMVDQNPKCLATIKATADKLQESANITMLRSDSTMLPRAPEPCHLAFIDPPYKLKLEEKGLKALANQNWLAKGAVVVVEQAHTEDLTIPEGFEKITERRYNLAKITILRYLG